jgi:carbon-monoxide dehydrogenase medium subunit
MIAIDDFFVSLFTTALKQDEILTEIRIPVPSARSGGAYLKIERKVGDYATAAVAVQLTLDGSGTVQNVRIGLTNAGPKPIKAKKAADFLKGKKLETSFIDQAAQFASDEAQPSSDLRGPAEYKKGLIKELTRRAIAKAAERVK